MGDDGVLFYSPLVHFFFYYCGPHRDLHGNFVLNFTNRESLPITHELVLISLPSGKSAQDVISAARATGPASEDKWLHFGEIPDVNSGATKAQTFDLPAGTYAFACWQTGNLGNPNAKGKAHAARGMVFQFTVT